MPADVDDDLRAAEEVFAGAGPSLAATERALRQQRLSIRNRLHSIVHDSDFVLEAARAFGVPILANERCGAWYVSPEKRAGLCYFKSTDGHFGGWDFSRRRVNLGVLERLDGRGERRDGICVVDSTRRGKRRLSIHPSSRARLILDMKIPQEVHS
jgi:tRNA A64-2'-O-ribosylphosphate transferase